MSIIFERLLKNGINKLLQQNLSKFQNGGMKGKGVVNGLFILRTTVNHAKHLNKELLITFYDIEKCFISLWLEDCIMGFGSERCHCFSNLFSKASVTIKTLWVILIH